MQIHQPLKALFAFRRPLLIAAASLALAPVLHAVTPPPDGGYPNQNTAEGDDALFNLTTGDSNTAIGGNFDAHRAPLQD